MSAPQPIAHLYITLRRGLAGVRESHRAVVASLGLRRREQTVRRRNDASIRGAVLKVGAVLRIGFEGLGQWRRPGAGGSWPAKAAAVRLPTACTVSPPSTFPHTCQLLSLHPPQVRQLLTVETDEQRAARLAAEATAAAPRPPLEFSHPPPPRQAQG